MTPPPNTQERRDYVIQGKLIPLGFEFLESLTTVAALKFPIHSRIAYLQNSGDTILFRDHGIDPTTTEGMLSVENRILEYRGNLNTIRFIEASGAGAGRLHIAYYF